MVDGASAVLLHKDLLKDKSAGVPGAILNVLSDSQLWELIYRKAKTGVEVARPTWCCTSGSCPDRHVSIALSAIMSGINHKRS